MFYDKQSNNQVLRMQTIHTGVPVNDEAAELRSVNDATSLLNIIKRIQGGSLVLNLRLSMPNLRPSLSYKSVNACPQMKVRAGAGHCPSHAHSTHLVRPLAAYFIMNNRIYQAPDVYSVLSNRLVCFFLALSLFPFPLTRPAYISLCTSIIA
jgi:mediator of RNA polymerase II transcription subunit 6